MSSVLKHILSKLPDDAPVKSVSIDDLLHLSKGKQVFVLGPSTIMHPAMFDFGVSAVCGVAMTHPSLAIRHLSQGGSFRHLPGIKYIAMQV